MSKDFPNRNDWLARRSTPAKLPGRYIHVSARIVTVKRVDGTFQDVVERPGTTLNIGSTARKAKAFAAKKAAKAELREVRRLQREMHEFDRELEEAETQVLRRFPAPDDREAA